MWAANIGAHQTGQSSLDFRLRDSSHIRQQILKLLKDLLERLRDVRNAIEDDEDDEIESLEDGSSDNEAPQTEIQQIHGNVATIINCLFQMSMLIRKPAQHDLRIGSSNIDVTHFEQFDYNHVRSKYPTADEQIVSRLSRGITRRRKYLRYRERHALKLKKGMDDGNIEQSSVSRSETLSDTIATDAQNWNVDFDDGASESGVSQTSYAPTLMTGSDITIPSRPRTSHGGVPFECPYCYFIIRVRSNRSWHRHVFNDLQPYICTERSCPTPDKLYATRHEWLQHGGKTHYGEKLSPTVSRGRGPDIKKQCTLCADFLDNTESYNRHMARHQQELALFALPSKEEDSDEKEHYSDTSSNGFDDLIAQILKELAEPSEIRRAVTAPLFEKERPWPPDKSDNGEEIVERSVERKEKENPDYSRPTYIKVHQMHLEPETLDVYEIPWEWDTVSCILIPQSKSHSPKANKLMLK